MDRYHVYGIVITTIAVLQLINLIPLVFRFQDVLEILVEKELNPKARNLTTITDKEDKFQRKWLLDDHYELKGLFLLINLEFAEFISYVFDSASMIVFSKVYQDDDTDRLGWWLVARLAIILLSILVILLNIWVMMSVYQFPHYWFLYTEFFKYLAITVVGAVTVYRASKKIVWNL